MKQFLVATMWLFCVGAAFAQNPQIEFEEYDLDNGLHVILHEDHTAPIVVVSVLYHVGSKNEDPQRTGFAHFFEHLLFEGSENVARGEFDKYVTNAGGINNANTTNDRTYYYDVLPSNQLALGLWLESERMMHAKIDPVGVETQREVVKEERRQRYDNQPYGTLLEEIVKRAYKVHPYKWTTIGSMEHLNDASLQEFVDFYNTFYVPQNATLSIAGDIEPKAAKKLIADYFAGIKKESTIPKIDVIEPKQTVEIRDTVYDNVQLPAVIEAYHMPAQGTDDTYALLMLSTLLSDGQSSRMYKSIVDDQQKAVTVGAFPFMLEDPGLYIAFAIANMGVDVNDLEASVNHEIDKVKETLITEKEYQKIRNQIENQFINSNSTVTGIAESLANYYVYYGDANLINTELERYMNVTREDIQRVAKKYLTPENRVVLHWLPQTAQ